MALLPNRTKLLYEEALELVRDDPHATNDNVAAALIVLSCAISSGDLVDMNEVAKSIGHFLPSAVEGIATSIENSLSNAVSDFNVSEVAESIDNLASAVRESKEK